MMTRIGIERLPSGGFVVHEMGRRDYDRGDVANGPIFACTKLDEALDFIRTKMGEVVTK